MAMSVRSNALMPTFLPRSAAGRSQLMKIVIRIGGGRRMARISAPRFHLMTSQPRRT
jgi:hypothetical protein